MKNPRLKGALSAGQRVLLALLPPLAAILALCIGRISIPPGDVLYSLLAKFGVAAALDKQTEIVLWTLRFPRVLLALLAGAGLSVAGCAFQSLFSNPLATPDTVGVASGACFGAVLGMLLGGGLVGVQLMALAFGLGAVGLTLLAAAGSRRSKNTVVLAGIMIGSLFNALISLVKFTADTESMLPVITYWLMGSLNSASYSTLLLGAPPIMIGILILYLLRWRMNLLPLSSDEAEAAGVNIKLLRAATMVCSAAITASCVSMCGQVGWIGLLVPHICRMKYGSNQLSLLPACASVGAAFMVAVDTLARSAQSAEIPVSIITAIIGAPFFIALVRRTGGWEL